MNYSSDLIRDLVHNKRVATDIEVKQLIDHVSQASFSSRMLKMNRWLRTELGNRGIQVSSTKQPSVEIHLLKRIYLDEQWPPTTTAAEFVADLQMAVAHSNCLIWTYELLDEIFAGFIAPSHIRNVSQPENFIFVAYSVDYDRIKTGYQTSSPDAVFTDDFRQRVQHR